MKKDKSSRKVSAEAKERQVGAELEQLKKWRLQLREHRARVQDDPQFLPVKQLAFEISRQLEKGDLDQQDLKGINRELSNRALLHRAQMMQQRFGEIRLDKTGERFRRLVEKSILRNGKPISFKAFKKIWEVPFHGAVFTAHPTFQMSRKLRAELVELIGMDEKLDCEKVNKRLRGLDHRPDPDITLQDEHEQVQEAIFFAQNASLGMIKIILQVARENWPQDWSSLVPRPVELNSWVGYDMDGRNDIKWFDSIRFRLHEKHLQIIRTLSMIERLRDDLGHSPARAPLDALQALFRTENELTARQEKLFAADLEDPKLLSVAANELTQNKDRGLGGDLTKAMHLLDEAVAVAKTQEESLEIAALRAFIKGQGLGTARMHFRVNAAQLHNVARAPLKLEGNVDLASRVMLKKLDKLIAKTTPQKINFASVALERATAIRQFLVIAQILKHIDGTAPIRLLIAECETPFTVLAAVYLAKLYGVDDKVDVSPLLETEEALDHGGRIISILLKTKAYREYIEQRGRLCVQTGFSDAGRFIGQIPAALAIERFHGQLADEVAAEKLAGKISVLIFDTHGESMGRGAHPESLRDRFDYVMSPWVRWHYRQHQLTLHHEVSFQGGDGYVLFGSDKLAFATLSSMLISGCEAALEAPDDQFYDDLDFSLDYFEQVKDYQTSLFENEDYRDALGAFGTGLLMKTGSRKSKRQFDAGHDKRAVVSEMRAIPHNAALQQMGYLLNIISGVGEAVRYEHDRFTDMVRGSERLRRIMALVHHARSLSSVKTLTSYASLFDDAFWVTRPLSKQENHLKNPCIYLADLLRGDSRHDGIMHLATYLREDAVRLHDVLAELGISETRSDEIWREGLDIMHALRIALIQHIYLLAARIPEFSLANDISREQVVGLIISFRITEAVALLREVYPVSMPQPLDYDLVEQADDLSDRGVSYASIQRDLIDPIEGAYDLVLEIGTGIAHNFGAHG